MIFSRILYYFYEKNESNRIHVKEAKLEKIKKEESDRKPV